MSILNDDMMCTVYIYTPLYTRIFTSRHVGVFVSLESSSYIDYEEFVPAKSAFTLNETLRGGCESGWDEWKALEDWQDTGGVPVLLLYWVVSFGARAIDIRWHWWYVYLNQYVCLSMKAWKFSTVFPLQNDRSEVEGDEHLNRWCRWRKTKGADFANASCFTYTYTSHIWCSWIIWPGIVHRSSKGFSHSFSLVKLVWRYPIIPHLSNHAACTWWPHVWFMQILEFGLMGTAFDTLTHGCKISHCSMQPWCVRRWKRTCTWPARPFTW